MASFVHQNGLRFYLDTSAVLPLILSSTGKVTGVEAAWVGRLTTFAAKAAAKQSRLLCSVLVVEELAATARNKKQADLAKAHGYPSWKDFKKANPGQAAIDQKTVQSHVLAVLKLAAKELKTYSITVEHPVVVSPSGVVLDAALAGVRLRDAHALLLSKYPTLDSMDAMHVAFGAELGCKHFVSFDNGWDGIAEILRLS